jgi:hypothetical protein
MMVRPEMMQIRKTGEEDTSTPMNQKTKGANITVTPKRTIPEGRGLWSGRFDFLIRPDCDVEYLRGRMGGYVNAIGLADSKEAFLGAVFSELQSRNVNPDDEYDEVEELSEKYLAGNLSDEWLALSDFTLKSGDIAFTTFDLYKTE